MDAVYENNYCELVELMKAQKSNYDFELVRRAFECCVQAHKGQLRSSKEEFYLHPFNVAKIVVSLGMDSQSIAAALLHDTVEDTFITLEDIKRDYGGEVALIVDGVTKLGKISYSTKEQQQAEIQRLQQMAAERQLHFF